MLGVNVIFVIGFLNDDDLPLPPFKIKKAGVVTIEACDELVFKFVLKKEWLKYKHTLGEYLKHYKELRACHLRALYSVLLKAAKLAHSNKIKHHQAPEISRMPSTV